MPNIFKLFIQHIFTEHLPTVLDTMCTYFKKKNSHCRLLLGNSLDRKFHLVPSVPFHTSNNTDLHPSASTNQSCGLYTITSPYCITYSRKVHPLRPTCQIPGPLLCLIPLTLLCICFFDYLVLKISFLSL